MSKLLSNLQWKMYRQFLLIGPRYHVAVFEIYVGCCLVETSASTSARFEM